MDFGDLYWSKMFRIWFKSGPISKVPTSKISEIMISMQTCVGNPPT